MSIEAWGIIASIVLAAFGIIRNQQNIRADIAKSDAEITKLKAEAAAHVTKKQADIGELGEQQMTKIIEQLGAILRMLERTTETITRKDEIILGLQATNFAILAQQIESQKLAIEAQLGANKQAEMLTAALTGVGRWPDIADNLKILIEKLTAAPMPVEVVNADKPVPVEVINNDKSQAA